MKFNSLQEIVNDLRNNNDIYEVNIKVDTELEIAEIADRFASINNSKALLFTNNGTDFPVLINLFGSENRCNNLLKIDGEHGYINNIDDLFSLITKKPKFNSTFIKQLLSLKNTFPSISRKNNCQSTIIREPDLNIFPILKNFPADGGRFITQGLTHTISTDGKAQNMGMYRLQIFDSKTLGMHWHKHKDGASLYSQWKKCKKRMPITITLGGDPILTYCATAPMPNNFSEYFLAGFLKQKPVSLIKSISNDIYIPECSDIVIEGYIDPEEPLKLEGPFGDHTGYYSLPDNYPIMHVTCISHRKNAIFPATMVGVPPKEDRFLGIATKKIFLPIIKTLFSTEIIDMNFPDEGCQHNLVIVKIKKKYPGQAIKVMNSLWGAGQMMFSKVIIIVDEKTDIYNKSCVYSALSKNVRPLFDIYNTQGPTDILDHCACKFGFGGKIGIDATTKIDEEFNDKHENPEPISGIFSPIGGNIYIVFSLMPFGEYGVMFTDLSTGNKKNASGIFIITDKEAEHLDKNLLIWYILSNTDPKRDITSIRNASANGVIIVNASRKGKKAVPSRKWPAVCVMDDNTVELVDKKWKEYSIGEFIESPSKKIKIFKRESYID